MSIISDYSNSGNRKINNKNVKYSNYALTLAQEAFSTGNLTEFEMVSIREKISEALSECILVYTHGESTSIMSDTANDLLTSLMFTIDAYLITLGDNNEALMEMKSESFKNLYYKGVKQLKLIICEIASLLVKLRRTRINTPNKLYNDILDGRIMKFLKTYDIAAKAHDGEKLEYPIAVSCSKMVGIYYIKGYLMNLYSENLYCKEYGTYEISRLYKTLCDVNKVPYDKAKFNIYTAVYLNAVFANYLMKGVENLYITYSDCTKIQKLFSTLTEIEQMEVIKSAAARVNHGNPDYNEKVLNTWMPQLLKSIQHGTLKNCLVAVKD
jgi:hypothetical protein